MGISITMHSPFSEGRDKNIQLEYKTGMTVQKVLEALDIAPDTIGVIKVNDLSGKIQYSLEVEVPDDSTIDFLPYLAGG